MRELLPWMLEAQEKLGASLRYHTAGQAVGPCPICEKLDGDGGNDRLVAFEDGGWFCRGCKRVHDSHHPNRKFSGWWSEDRANPEQIKARKQEKMERAKAMYTQMHGNQDWVGYHQAVMKNDDLRVLWLDLGIAEDTIIRWGLGYCTETPCDDEKRPSLTIPVFYGAKLYDIRHRVIGAEKGAKYRSHVPGLTPIYFNLDGIKGGNKVLVVEGEKKAITLMQEGFSPCVAYPGANFLHYLPTLIKRDGTKDQEFIFLPDPGTESRLEQALKPLVQQGWICSMIDPLEKPDDLLIEYGPETFGDMLNMRRQL